MAETEAEPHSPDRSDGTVLRLATPADEETLVPLVREFYAHFGYPYDEDEKRSVLASVLRSPSAGRLFLLEDGGSEPAGYLFLSFYVSVEYGGLTAFVDELFVRPARRGAGLGTRALHEVFALAPALGLRAVHLETERTNTRAAELYVRLGFVDYERRLLTRLVPRGV